MKYNVIFNELSISERIELLAELHNADRTVMGMERIEMEYGMSGRNIARYIRCDRLIPGFKRMLDDGTLTVAAAVDISYLTEKEQGVVLDVVENIGARLDRDVAKLIRMAAGSITTESVQAIFGVDKPMEIIGRAVSLVLPQKVYVRYFGDVAVKDVRGIVEAALDMYFCNREAVADV